jgi:hypothetical protein
MRSNGVTNYPDPSGSGRPESLSQFNPSSPTFLRAYEACQKYAPVGEGGGPLHPRPPSCASRSGSPVAFAHTGSRGSRTR